MSQSVRKVIIPVAGFGTRFLPATKAMPKEMLPIIDKPVIQYVVEEAVASGITDVILVTSHAKRAVEDHFDENPLLESWLQQQGKLDFLEQIREVTKMANFIYIRQKGPYGNATPVLNAAHLIGPDEPFAMVFGDDVYTGAVPRIKQMIDVYEKYHDPVVGVVEVPKAEVKRYGVIDPQAEVEPGVYQCRNVVEKPSPEETPSCLATNAGFILTPDIFEEIRRLKPDRAGELVTLEAVKSLMKKRPLYARKIEGEYHDTGSKIGWLRANMVMALRREDLKKEARKMVEEFFVL